MYIEAKEYSALIAGIEDRDKEITALRNVNQGSLAKLRAVERQLSTIADECFRLNTKLNSVEKRQQESQQQNVASGRVALPREEEPQVPKVDDQQPLLKLEKEKAHATEKLQEAQGRIQAQETEIQKLKQELSVSLVKQQQAEQANKSANSVAPVRSSTPQRDSSSEVQRLRQQVAELEASLAEASILRRGVYTSLGLRAGEASTGANQIVVREVRPPASKSGLREGDVLERVVLEKDYWLTSIGEFAKLTVEMPPESVATVHALRGDQRRVFRINATTLPNLLGEQ